MAKKKTTVRKSTRQSTYPHRSSTTNSKAASVSPSNASSPSPPPQSDNHHHHSHTAASSSSSSASSPTSPAAMTTCGSSSSSRRKGLPRRSPSQNDPSKGIVFSFRFQNDPGLSMAVDIRSYDQQFGPPDPDSCEKADSKVAGLSAGSSSLSLAGSHALLHKSVDDTIKADSIHGGAAGGAVRMNGGHWSSDPTAYRNSNVYDHTRNLLILHTRKPSPQAVLSGSSQAESGVSPTTTTAAGAQASAMATTATTATKGAVAPVTTSSSPPSNSNHPAAFHPYRTQRRSSSSSSSQSSSPTSSTSSFPSTPALSQTGSSSSSSSSSSSASSSPSSPTSPHSLSSSSASRQQLTKCGGDSGLPMPLTLDALSAAQSSTRFLNVRGLGGASRGRRMQVILVS
ncbi:hypothetical protein BGX30_010915 [Mortierella sp. GBA39]|nr:hypothetical protein BGX30_010915 [Mortierella sp. GBA39]